MFRGSAQGIPILMYHSISDHARSRFRKFALSPVRFAEQMAFLANHHFTTLTVSQYTYARRIGAAFTGPFVVLTFDDGYADFYEAALPVLQRYNLVATLYVSTAFVNGSSRFLQHEQETNRPMLTWEQLIEIGASNIECGAHSHRHLQLDFIPETVARAEITHSKRILEENLGREISSFAYPYGYYRPAVQEMVRQAGYLSACAVRYNLSSPADDPFALSRLIVPGDTDLHQFAGILTNHGPQLIPSYKRVRSFAWRCVRSSLIALKYGHKRGNYHDPGYA